MRWLIILSFVLVAGCAKYQHEQQQKQLDEVRGDNTFEAYDKFLEKYPDTDFKETTLYYRDKLWVDTAIEHNDRASLIEFLHARPDSAWVERAHYFLEHGFTDVALGLDDDTCSHACHEGDVEVGHANLSPRYRENIRLAEVKKLNTVEAYDRFLAEFPDSIQSEAIRYDRDQLWVDQAIAKKDRVGLTRFIRAEPESKWFDRAHYYLQNKFNVAERDDEDDCSECHKDGIPERHQSRLKKHG